jgi:hypothetical protein
MAKRAAEAWDADNKPRVIGDIIAVHADEVDATDRLREIDGAWAAALGSVMLAEGQHTPILVTRQAKGKPWKLLAGGHRHAAAEIFPDLNPLKAIEAEGSILDRRLMQVSENVWRKDLDPFDRATFVEEMYDVLRAKAMIAPGVSAQQIAAGARWKKEIRKDAGDASEIVSHAYGFTTIIAESLQLSRRSIELDLMLVRRLPGAIRSQIAHLPLYRNATQLRALAKLDRADQEAVVARLITGVAKSVPEALAHWRGRAKPSDEDKRLSSFIGTYGRMGLAEKKAALVQLAGMLPAGFTLQQPGESK